MEYSTQNDILQPILENGIEGFSEVLQKMLNLAMKLEREKGTESFPVSKNRRTDRLCERIQRTSYSKPNGRS